MSGVQSLDDIMKELLRGRDGNFVCAGCNGDMVSVRERDGRKDFACNGCGQKLRECTVCHMPRSNWGDDGAVCSGCVLGAMAGEITLTEEQARGIAKWAVIIESPLKA